MSSLALVVLLLPIAGSLVMHLSTCPVQHQRGIPSAQTRSCSTPLMLASSTPQPVHACAKYGHARHGVLWPEQFYWFCYS